MQRSVGIFSAGSSILDCPDITAQFPVWVSAYVPGFACVTLMQ